MASDIIDKFKEAADGGYGVGNIHKDGVAVIANALDDLTSLCQFVKEIAEGSFHDSNWPLVKEIVDRHLRDPLLDQLVELYDQGLSDEEIEEKIHPDLDFNTRTFVRIIRRLRDE